MRIGVTALSLSLAACGFSAPGANATDDVGPSDSSMGSEPTTGVDGPLADGRLPDGPSEPDAPSCYGGGLAMVCPSITVPPTLDLSTLGSFDTDTGPCMENLSIDGVQVCVLEAVQVVSGANGFVPTGGKPLILLGTQTITITSFVSVSSHPASQHVGAGAGVGGCGAYGQSPGTSNGGGGGGAGGSFRGGGGSGGVGDTNGVDAKGGTAPPLIQLTKLHGGCSGQQGGNSNVAGGVGGPGAGAVYLIAGTSIEVPGTGGVYALGAGGRGGGYESGGGGGGSGGLIGLDAPMLILSGELIATGGGGGEGGANTTHGDAGNPGDDGVPTADARAQGGRLRSDQGGDGGDGAGGTMPNGLNPLTGGNGYPDLGAGGGGGGGAGYIYLRGAVTGVPVVFPSITN